MATFDLRELAKIPYLVVDGMGDRDLSLAPLWDGAEWHAWVPRPDGTLFPVKPRDVGEGIYLAREEARADDIYFPFASFVWQRASWAEVRHWYRAIIEDVHQLAASIAKIDFFWAMRERAPGGGLGIRRFVSSELEYLLTVCRSVFDELQEVVGAIWGRVRLLDQEQQRRKGQLRSSFADMVIVNGELMTAEQIAERRRIPPPLAAAYASAGSFLVLLRGLRDGIIHHGKDAPVVGAAERGFVVLKNEKAFASLPIWNDEHSLNEHAVSLRPALAYVAVTTLHTCNTFADILGQLFEFPRDLAPDHRLFIRSVHGGALIAAQDILQGASPWWTETCPSRPCSGGR